MEKRLWIFYYTLKENEWEKIVVARQEFIKPDRSKSWKDLQKLLADEKIKTVGYCLPSNFETA